MQKSQLLQHIRLSLALAGLFLGTLPCLTAQEPTRCPNPIYDAQKFLQALYPESKGKGYAILYSVGGTYDTAWSYLPRLEVNLLDTSYTPSVQLLLDKEARKSDPPPSLLLAYFDFDKDSRFERISIGGDILANDTKRAQIEQKVNKRQNWSDAQVARALKEAGAKYGPEDKL
jgi:hypothetical protein